MLYRLLSRGVHEVCFAGKTRGEDFGLPGTMGGLVRCTLPRFQVTFGAGGDAVGADSEHGVGQAMSCATGFGCLSTLMVAAGPSSAGTSAFACVHDMDSSVTCA